MNVAPLNSTHGLTASEIRPSLTALTPQERAHAAGLKGAALRNAAPAEQRAAVAAQFEAILVRQLLGKTMTSMMGQQNSASSSIYGDLLTDTVSQKLTAGSGLGLARLLEQQLTPRTASQPAPTPSAP